MNVNNSTNRFMEWLVRGLAVLGGTGALGIVDLGLGLAHPLVILLAVTVALVASRLSGTALGVGALVLGAAMLAATMGTQAGAASGVRQALPFGLTVVAVALLVIGLTAWRAAPKATAFALPLLLAALVLQPLRLSSDKISLLVFALVLALAGVITAGTGLWVRTSQISRRRGEMARQLAQRTSIASDLHDYVAHHVTGIVVLAQAAQSVAAQQPQAVLPALQRIEQAGDEAMTAIRRMVTLLREAGTEARLSPLGTISDIASLTDHFTSADDMRLRLSVEGDFDDVPIDVQSAVHRVVTEALTNVRKHAEGVRELVILVGRDTRFDMVTVEVANDGRSRGGHSSEGGYGLAGLRERAEALGGSFVAGPRSEGGWHVQAFIPAGGA
ncbi:sensor histidine kinase [Streptomyces sp. 900116325]